MIKNDLQRHEVFLQLCSVETFVVLPSFDCYSRFFSLKFQFLLKSREEIGRGDVSNQQIAMQYVFTLPKKSVEAVLIVESNESTERRLHFCFWLDQRFVSREF